MQINSKVYWWQQFVHPISLGLLIVEQSLLCNRYFYGIGSQEIFNSASAIHGPIRVLYIYTELQFSYKPRTTHFCSSVICSKPWTASFSICLNLATTNYKSKTYCPPRYDRAWIAFVVQIYSRKNNRPKPEWDIEQLIELCGKCFKLTSAIYLVAVFLYVPYV